jgi:predicted  nucleic acid-binding Zn-ribbon protein
MPAKELGTKHLCFKCGTKFYDLKKPEPICPKCGADQRQSPALKAPASEKRSRPPARPAPPPPPAVEEPAAEELDDDVEPDDDDEDDDEDDEP